MHIIQKAKLNSYEQCLAQSLSDLCNSHDPYPSSAETEPDPSCECFFLLGYRDESKKELSAFASCMQDESKKELSAFASCMLLRDMEQNRILPEATFTLHVAPSERKQGLGTRLLAELITGCRARSNAREIHLHTYTGPEGDGFHAAHAWGFSVTAKELLMRISLPAPSLHSCPENFTLRPCRNFKTLSSLYHRIFSVPLSAGELVMDELLAMDEVSSFVLFQGKRPVGMCMLLTEGSIPYFFNVGILPEFRRKHLASAMTGEVLAQLPADISAVSLQVSGDNEAAVRLYEGLGFSTSTVILEQSAWK